MRRRVPSRTQYTVQCDCGAPMTLDARNFGRPRPCRSCGAAVTVAWGQDPASRRAKPVVVVQKGVEGATAFCGCGYSRAARPDEVHIAPECPGCGKRMNVRKAPGPKTVAKAAQEPKKKPAAPVLPLHLSPPKVARVKRGAKFFLCGCGEQIIIRGGKTDRRIHCLVCDLVHTVEEVAEAPPESAAPKAAPRPAPKPLPRPSSETKVRPSRAGSIGQAPSAPEKPPPPKPTRELKPGEFVCPCGEVQPPRTSKTGRQFTCEKCGRKGHVELSTDATTGKASVTPIVTSEPKVPEPAAPPPAPEPPPGKPLAPEEKELVEFEELVEAIPAGPPTESQQLNIFELVLQPTEEEEPGAMPPNAQVVICGCGIDLLISPQDVGRPIQCPGCGDRMVVEEEAAAGRQTALSVRKIMASDTQRWSMDDFS